MWIEYFGAERVSSEQCKKYMEYYPKAREERRLATNLYKKEIAAEKCINTKCSISDQDINLSQPDVCSIKKCGKHLKKVTTAKEQFNNFFES